MTFQPSFQTQQVPAHGPLVVSEPRGLPWGPHARLGALGSALRGPQHTEESFTASLLCPEVVVVLLVLLGEEGDGKRCTETAGLTPHV